jgi:hypothetical protein
MLTIHGLHHQRADTERLHVHRKKRGGGLMKIDRNKVAEINRFMGYGIYGRQKRSADANYQNTPTEHKTQNYYKQQKTSRNIFEMKPRE